MKTLVDHPLVLDLAASYTFHSYFEMRFAPADILADLGCTLKRDHLNLPQADLAMSSDLQQRITAYLPYVSLTSEAARREVLVAPLLLELATMTQTSLQIEYPIVVDQYLKGDIDYYLKTHQGLLVVEAKNADLTRGFVQLAVELIALYLWLGKRESQDPLPSTLIGAVTTGDIWQFGCYTPHDRQVIQDLTLYRVPDDLRSLTSRLQGVLAARS